MNIKLTRRNFIKYYIFFSILTASYFFFYENSTYAYRPPKIKVENVDIYIKNLPEDFNNFTIAQISDLHKGETVETWLIEKTVKETNKLKPDCIVITGDIANNIEELDKCLKILDKLKAQYGIYAVMGNWERSFGIQKVKTLFMQSKIKLLSNESVILKKKSASIYLVGLDDDGGIGNNINKTFNKLDNKRIKILLNHNPYIVANINKTDQQIDLILSGHTHGGQIIYPILGPVRVPKAFGLKFISGLYKHNNTQLYINRGIGVVHFPYRINCPPEITLINLKNKY